MLTLTRRIGERIAIGHEIEVEVLSISRGRVRIGIRAPRELPVHRGELLDRIESENQRALGAKMDLPAIEDAAIAFPDGLPGLRDHTSFLLCELGEGSPFRVLVSRKNPAIQLLVIDQVDLGVEYPVDDAKKLAGYDEDVAVGFVVTAPADGSPATANLVAPLVFGLDSRRGVQIILEREGLGFRHVLVPDNASKLAATGDSSSNPANADR